MASFLNVNFHAKTNEIINSLIEFNRSMLMLKTQIYKSTKIRESEKKCGKIAENGENVKNKNLAKNAIYV